MSHTSDAAVATIATASSLLQYVFAAIGVIGYFVSAAWMWRGVYGVAASVIAHLVFRAWHNHNTRPDAL
ncbi:MAG: hypothetical protein ABI818_01865 [Acidobacteriota bacterium]